MTRYTNFARKRTYVDAGFNTSALDPVDSGNQDVHENPQPDNAENTIVSSAAAPPKKCKRHGSQKSKVDGSENGIASTTGDADAAAPSGQSSGDATLSSRSRSTGKKDRKQEKRRGRGMYQAVSSSERRRLQRIDDRHADTICFACREKGHTARDCTTFIAPATDGAEGQGGGARAKPGRSAVGICYRCGSWRHNLSKCREPVDPENPLPYASCFVCSGQGHLASSCPKNQSKGIYPNGGSCKLCGETTHLAKDCPLRKKETVTASTVFLGTGREAGADEDDFHTLKRKNAEIDQAEKFVEKTKRQANVKVGAFTGVVKAFGKASAPVTKKKVVTF
ncbi:hypothetical protein CERSUDRAFT_159922 [Gelatoporia subvermispora B]|uniref:CCHC-type domain-containing protein n=1 Tax=Ceriporiopsis subvermispora (strain B) TaxID=914234 RepID=M2PD42_CERS8|nr:hypothetical protein CERSUDRAFT_159922 [Gelatoporia subvermispora B]